ncbi:chemotaxis protein CheW [Nisaea acidiphila]|uniref:Chemotaxis protein CheW n=1 Tax=Nisaea acidiphila TaxID=1862145 RepID=A0A9J7AZ28_9PROT|nr:chemotaxis protein CheW [Nisaea acidiphila]UUX50693.1 chemotaxis protein CheW [Nisaea acidiphila]
MSVAESVFETQKIPVLLFQSGDRRYGVMLSSVREVVEIEDMEPIEGDREDEHEEYIGVMVLRKEPIPLVVVRPGVHDPVTELPMCIVLQRGHAVIGLAVQKIIGIRNFDPAHPTKGLTSSDQAQHAYLDEEGKIVQAVDPDRWFNAQSTLPLLADQRALKLVPDEKEEVKKARKTFMALTVKGHLYAVDSSLVERAIDDVGTTPLPKRPGVRLDSVIEVSGSVLPVLRLTPDGFESQTIHIIVNYYDQKWAIATEQVLGIVSDESPPGPATDESQARVISHKGAFHEVIDLSALISQMVPDFVRSDGRG